MKATVTLDIEEELLTKLETRLMAAFDELSGKIDQVGATLGAEHAEVAAAVDALNATIADLRTQLEGMLTPDQFATLTSKLDSLNEQAAHIFDAPATPTPVEPDVNPDEPPPAPELPPVE